MDPQAPAQPSIDTSYNHPDNPSEQDPVEKSQAESTTASLSRSDATTEKRQAGDVSSSGASGQDEATPSSLAMGGQGEGDKDVGCPFLFAPPYSSQIARKMDYYFENTAHRLHTTHERGRLTLMTNFFCYRVGGTPGVEHRRRADACCGRG